MAAGAPDERTAREVSAPIGVALGADTHIVDTAAFMLQRGVDQIVVAISEHSYAVVTIKEVAAALVQAVADRCWISNLVPRVEGEAVKRTGWRQFDPALDPHSPWMPGVVTPRPG